MLRSAAVSKVQQGLSFRRTNETEIIDALQTAQRDLEMGKTLPWFLLSEDQTMSGTASVAYVTPPTGWITLDDDAAVKYYDSSGNYVRRLEKGSFDQLEEVWKGSSITTPYAYALRKSTIHVFPTPTAAFTLKASFYVADTVLSSNVENAWLANAPDLLIAEAGLLMAADLNDEVAGKKFIALQARAASALHAQNIARQMDGRTYRMGGSH